MIPQRGTLVAGMQRLLRTDWEAIAGISAAIVAIILHSLHLFEDILVPIIALLVALQFIRALRRERSAEKAEARIRSIEATVGSMASDLAPLKAAILELQHAQRGTRVHVYKSRSELYLAISGVLEKAMNTSGEKRLDLAALHGHSGDRLTDEHDVEDEFSAFNTTMSKCIHKPGSEWRVRYVYNITTEDRLRVIEHRLNSTANADGLEVKAFCSQHSIPHLAPLVAASDEVFIGIEDPRYYRVHQGFHVKSRYIGDIVTKYFDSLWSRDDAFELRSADRVRTEELDRLRRQIASLPLHHSQELTHE